MKENEYRGKRVDNGEWVYGCFIGQNVIFPQENIIWDIGGWVDDSFGFECIKETICPFIGLRDEKDKKAYEGDIIRANYKYEGCSECGVEPDQDCFCQGIVVYDEKRACFALKIIESEYLSFIDVDDIIPLFYFDLEGGFEILGNIYNK